MRVSELSARDRGVGGALPGHGSCRAPACLDSWLRRYGRVAAEQGPDF
jgi:hypothetical protein